MHTEKKGKTPIVILFFTLMAYNTDNHRIVMTTVGLRWSPASCRKVSYAYADLLHRAGRFRTPTIIFQSLHETTPQPKYLSKGASFMYFPIVNATLYKQKHPERLLLGV